MGRIHPRWRPDGTELYYIAPDGKLMASPVGLNGATIEPGRPVALFSHADLRWRYGMNYDVWTAVS
jgi:hypothetical protein